MYNQRLSYFTFLCIMIQTFPFNSCNLSNDMEDPGMIISQNGGIQSCLVHQATGSKQIHFLRTPSVTNQQFIIQPPRAKSLLNKSLYRNRAKNTCVRVELNSLYYLNIRKIIHKVVNQSITIQRGILSLQAHQNLTWYINKFSCSSPPPPIFKFSK